MVDDDTVDDDDMVDDDTVDDDDDAVILFSLLIVTSEGKMNPDSLNSFSSLNFPILFKSNSIITRSGLLLLINDSNDNIEMFNTL